MKFIDLQAGTAFIDAIESLAGDGRIVVCGSDEDRQYIEESIDASAQPVDDILAGAADIDIQAWFSERKKAFEQEWNKGIAEVLGEWPGEIDPKQGFTLAFDVLSGEPLTRVVGASIDTEASWQVPAHFKYGGWNECPAPQLHCAIWKYWQEKYGAQIVGVSNDVIEAYVTNPPKTEEAAMELAWEQYFYCADIVDQGVETIANLGGSVINHNVWYFWWD